jgi:uncharacterized protein YcnI
VRLAAAILAALLLPAALASAHVEVEPARAPAGSDARLTFEVPNERPDAATTRIVIQMPAGVTSVEGVALRGWRLATRPATGNVRRATLTAAPGRELAGEQKGRFRLLVGLPRRAGATLVFKVLQVYDDGEIVRWLGPEGTSEPAPSLKLTAAREPAPAPAPAQDSTQPEPDQAQPQDSGDGDGDGDGGVPIWAGVSLILLAAVAGSALARRRNRRRLDRPD